jgi:hypothetical protein
VVFIEVAMNEKINQFAYKYQAVCKPSSQYHRRVQPVPVKFGEDPADVLYQELPYQMVPMVEIHLPEDRFRALIEHDAFLDNHNHDRLRNSTTGSHVYYDMMRAKSIIEEHEKECLIRNQNPSVRAAYDQYLTVLHLCR